MIVIISGTSGSGKTTVVNALLAKCSTFHRVITYTTRPMRENEVNGKDYHFVTEKTFKEMKEDGEFIESANVYGYSYGTPLLWSGASIFLLITDVQGFRTIKEKIGHSERLMSVFITSPQFEDRLLARKTEDEESIHRRLDEASKELMAAKEYDYSINNDNFGYALETLELLIRENYAK